VKAQTAVGSLLLTAIFVVVAVSAAACGESSTPPVSHASSQGVPTGQDQGAPTGQGAPTRQGAPAGHEHHAPHGGTLVELGEEAAHIELVLDRSSGGLTAYVLDGEAEESVRIAQRSLDLVIDAPGPPGRVLQLAARANVLTGETVGDSSEFGATDGALQTNGTITGQVTHIQVKGQAFDHLPFEVSYR
jgi:hypothetical protein